MRRSGIRHLVVFLASAMAAIPGFAAQPFGSDAHSDKTTQAKSMDRDLMEITAPGLEALYAKHRYTVTEVTQWYLDRITRYDGTYRAILYLDKHGALLRASEEDAEPKNAKHGSLWGVPIVVKANTSVKGWVTSAGWVGFLRPGEELVAHARCGGSAATSRGRSGTSWPNKYAGLCGERYKREYCRWQDGRRVRRTLFSGRFVRRNGSGCSG